MLERRSSGGPDILDSRPAARRATRLAAEIETQPASEPSAHRATDASFAAVIGRWVAAWIFIQSLAWLSGLRMTELTIAVEAGAAEVERRAVGEVGEDQTREAIADQRDTIRFWTALALARDFVIGPLGLVARALVS